MRVTKMEQYKFEKNALPVHSQARTGESKSVLKSDQKEVSPFCEFCKPIKSGSELKDLEVFTDRYGFSWRCLNPSCPHAIRIGPAVLDCMVLNRIFTRRPGNLQDIINPTGKNRRKNRVHLNNEMKMITGSMVAV